MILIRRDKERKYAKKLKKKAVESKEMGKEDRMKEK